MILWFYVCFYNEWMRWCQYDSKLNRGVMVKVLASRILVCEFELQLGYYVHFRAIIFGKGMNSHLWVK